MSCIARTQCTKGFRAEAGKRSSLPIEGPKLAPAFRYRRSTVTKAPRKRTFIANMEKYLIDRQTVLANTPANFIKGQGLALTPRMSHAPACNATAIEKEELVLVSAYWVDAGLNLTAGGQGGGNGKALSHDFSDDNDGTTPLLNFLIPLMMLAAVALMVTFNPELLPESVRAHTVDPHTAFSLICGAFLLSMIHYVVCTL